MLRNYLKIAWRNLVNQKAYSFINITGLASGMLVSLLIGLWVLDEVSYDRFHANAPQLFRVTATVSNMEAAISSTRLAPALTAQLPAVRAAVRLKDTQELVNVAGQMFDEKRAFFVDPTFLTVFSFRLLQGNAQTALNQPTGVVITKQTALRYFGTTSALGKTIRLLQTTPQGETWLETTVTGVLQNVPANSHLQFDLLLPFSRYVGTERYAKNDAWDAFSLFTYLWVDQQATENRTLLEQQINQLFIRQQAGVNATFHLQPLTDIHLRSPARMVQDVEGQGSYQYVQIFAVVSLVILLIACINFMNLATARATRRAKEVGLRKVIGATRWQLIGQFLSEAFIVSGLASGLAGLLIILLLPMFNQLTGKQLTVDFFAPVLALTLAGVTVATAVVAGSYPAFLLANIKAIQNVASGAVSRQQSGFRNGLVVVQFSTLR